MAHEELHEARKHLSKPTRDMHRALVSLQEEFEAVDWYRQRADACRDGPLSEILLHNMREEMEHAAMLIEWLRRNDSFFDRQLRTYVFSDAPITEVEEDSTATRSADTAGTHTIGALKE